jgi:CheY-like chemotaxis protein
MGFVPTAVATAREALEELWVHSFDLIIVDAHLTHMHGAELARVIRRGTHAATPIVAISSDDSADNIRRLRESGVSEFAVKPVTTEKLRELLNRWLYPPSHPK